MQKASRYNLTALLEQVCCYAEPDYNRRNLMRCYFAIAEHMSYNEEETGQELGTALSCLRFLIEALDTMTKTADIDLKVTLSDEPGTIETLDELAEELSEVRDKFKKANHRAGVWYDIYQHLLMMASPLLSEEQKEKHKEFKNRLLESTKE